MYLVVEFINEKPVAVVANSWLVADNVVMWPKSDKKRTSLLERNERPPDGTPVHPLRVLSESLTLALARQRVEKALIPVAYPSDSDTEEDESEDEASVTSKKLAQWPSMEPRP
ncbi:unnamed protein product [Dibothriocephalus latus]|uniref:Uncharacterized protein n=1 Tax=Dibothriocephalus latus TaxID=60516 RepID=A0A3P7N718_DIBLA|nr:unnamed protein product [Dibothriocephalus latus]